MSAAPDRTPAPIRGETPVWGEMPARAVGLVGLFLAALLVAVFLTPVAFGVAGRGVVVVLLAVQAVMLIRARERPVSTAAVVIVLGVVVAALTTSVGPGLAPAALFALAYGAPAAVSRLGLVAAVATSPVSLWHSPWPAVPITVATAVAVWALGGLLRAQAASQASAARAAAEADRAALTREVHDVVGHSLASIIVQAGAATDAFDRDPELARRAVAAIDDSARTALGEVRRVISGAGEQHGPAELPALLAGVRANGIETSLEVQGDTSTLPDAVGTSIYRIVQESLTNVLKHSRARHVSVVVRRDVNRVMVAVTNDGVAPRARGVDGSTGGHGIPGMRARADLHGGSLSAGPHHDARFRVEAVLLLTTTNEPVTGSVA